MIYKTLDEIKGMCTEDIRLEMLQIWHDVDFTPMDVEEQERVKQQLMLYREVLHERHYDYRYPHRPF